MTIAKAHYVSLFAILTIFAFILIQAVELREAPNTDGAFYALSVQNREEMVAWYTTKLGFTLQSQGENDQRKGALLSRPGALLEIAEFSTAISRASLGADIESHEIYGIFKFGFLVQDIDNTYEQALDNELEILFPIVTASEGSRTFGVTDPEGNIVQFFGN